ncbi:hypothetical protein DL96DRAFT_636027 [Flagelloscypha sp. PMI_526]|nr:hypothetical protein DL96DRAFT_636027 [Flagelloscypha sp. PMI_526]
MKSFQDVPVDIARLIFESAAVSDRSTACALSCVSREVQFWSDPFLFRNVVIQDEGTVREAMLEFIDNFISEDPPSRILRARDYVQRFSTKQDNDQENRIPKFIGLCTALESLCLWTLDLTAPFLPINIPSLRKISFSSFDKGPQTFNVPLFHSVTHLEIDSADPISIWKAELSSMSSLTHLVLVLLDQNKIATAISTVSCSLPSHLQVLLLVMRRTEQSSLEGISYDERIVIGVSLRSNEVPSESNSYAEYVYEEDWAAWTGETSEVDTCWAKAELLLRDKQRKAKIMD